LLLVVIRQQTQEDEMGEGPTRIRRSAKSRVRYYAAIAAAAVAGAGLAVGATAGTAGAAARTASSVTAPASSFLFAPTATPIKHVVVIFDENISFDHYFGTYPFAANTDGNPFHAAPSTPKVNGLYRSITSSGPTGPMLTNNPNTGNDGKPANPTRLTPAQALTCDQDHGYTAEQQAFNGGKMDKFVQFTNVSSCSPPNYSAPNLVMDYYDGNTVTGLWNYAQHYAMSDNNYNTNFGPSTPGALNVISGYDGSSYAVDPTTGAKITTPIPGTVSALNGAGLGTIYGDLDPAYRRSGQRLAGVVIVGRYPCSGTGNSPRS
jgi:phospholipase C